MRMWGKVFILLAILPAILIMPSIMVQSSAQQATGSTTILPSTCGLSFPNGSAINYGPLMKNTLSSIVKLNMTNTGTTNATLTVEGGNWKDASNNDVMLVNVTHYSVYAPNFVYAQNGIALTNSSQNIVIGFAPAIIQPTYWQILTTLINPSFSGNATQTMNFTASC
jgi:hypothetical protein